MDMKPGRELAQRLSKKKKVLNLFSYTCSFSVAAKAGEAERVINVDMKKSFLKTGEKNHQLNSLEGNVGYLSNDIMKSLSGLKKKGPYDLIIVDPPSNQKSFHLKKDYPKLLGKCKEWLSNDGKILACLNNPFLGMEFLREHNPGLKIENEFYGAFKEEDPEKGLKMVLFSLPAES